MAKDLKSELKKIPHKPGVYLFKNELNKVIYVGKATDLKNRISQYIYKNDHRAQIPFLIEEAGSVEHIIASNEWEALLLENSLIKKYLPKYNIRLRDDKNYALIKINYQSQIPQIEISRQADFKNAKCFGPYASALKVRETLRTVRKIFPYCANSEVGTRPCFYYYLHRCPGVCVGKISLREYEKNIREIAAFLSGHISGAQKLLRGQMQAAAKQKKFERAATFRDQLRALEVISRSQKVIFLRKLNWDFISFFARDDKAAINVFMIRDGALVDRKNFIMENAADTTGAAIIAAFINRYYLPTENLPKIIYTQELAAGLKNILIQKNRIPIKKPLRGKKTQLIKLGSENAADFFENWIKDQAGESFRAQDGLAELQKKLNLARAPQRIECFDISNIQGANSVASMVVFENGQPKKSEYRKFKIRLDGKADDFAMMREALLRRFDPQREQRSGSANWPLPELLVIDGGKGQLGVAIAVLRQYQLQIPALSLAKREEEIFVPGKSQPLLLDKNNSGLQLLQRVRDEAHRFAISFHKQLRSKQAFKSALDTLPGIGPKRKKQLLQHFGAVQNIRDAAIPELAKILGEKLAKKIKTQL